jgi:hypothetical protein
MEHESIYARTFTAGDRPKEAVDLCCKRLKSALVLEDEAHSFFKERAAIEDKYAAELQRLYNKRCGFLSSLDDKSPLAALWAGVLANLNTAASQSAQHAADISVKIVDAAFKNAVLPDELALKSGKFPPSSLVKASQEFSDRISRLDKRLEKEKKLSAGQLSEKVANLSASVTSGRQEWLVEATSFFNVL